MIGVYDFCGHYEWTFDWLEREGGHALVRAYWDEAIHRDSQLHARELILRDGFAGMLKYWGHPLIEESPSLGFTLTPTAEVFRTDMQDRPSKGFLIRNGLAQYRDYCDHCLGWVGPLMREAGFVIDHEHNHCGQCWWEIRKAGSPAEPSAPGTLAKDNDVRTLPNWQPPGSHLDRYRRASDPDMKLSDQ